MGLKDIRSPAGFHDMRALLSEIKELQRTGRGEGCIVGPKEVSMRMAQSERWVHYWPSGEGAAKLLAEFIEEQPQLPVEECIQCSKEKPCHIEDGVPICADCVASNEEELAQIEELEAAGHTPECAARHVYGDGGCGCGVGT